MKNINENVQLCIEIYEEFYRSVSLNQNFTYKPTEKELTTLDKFFKYFEKEYKKEAIGATFLINFIEFSFNLTYSRKTKFRQGLIFWNWIFGKKSIKRYLELKDKDWGRFKRKIRRETTIRILNKYRLKETKELFNDYVIELNDNEEKYKQQFFNKKAGFLWCIANTTLFNPKSMNCVLCKNKEKCKLLLKQEYKNLYKKRGLENG